MTHTSNERATEKVLFDACVRAKPPGAAPVKVRAHPTSSQSIKVSWKFRIVRALVPPSGEETGPLKISCGNWYRLYSAEIKSNTSSWGMD
ncbi:hypothetical protein TNCV_3578681 [Trichonephila clavipes]|nr:hypothetical protein TNCV_3578681 [Trichonephila clavipes]